MEKAFLVYKHTAPNGKSYIGQTNNLNRRNAIHKSTTGCRAFSSAIKKYGWDAFTHEILAEGLTLEEANRLEQELIESHNTLSPNGYNLKTGGKNGRPSEESIRKSADARRGKKLSPAQVQRLVDLGKQMSPDRLQKLQQGAAEARERMKGKPHPNLGRKQNDDHKRKTSAASKANWENPEYRAKTISARTGKTRSEETKAKQAEAARLRWEKRRAEGKAKEAPEVTAKRAAILREVWRQKKEAAQGDLLNAA